MPLTGGTTRPFLARGNSTPSWSPDNARLAFIGADAQRRSPVSRRPHGRGRSSRRSESRPGQDAFFEEGGHTHNPVWSPDGQWIYFVHGTGPTGRMDVWRMKPSGEAPEQLTHQHADVNFLAPLDLRTLLYVARAEDWSGPWLWALDVESRVTRRVTVGLEQYTSVSASRDGRRVVATVANPTASLWRVPLRDEPVEDRDAEPYPAPAERALAPRFNGSVAVLSLALDPRDRRRALAGSERPGVRSAEGRRQCLDRARRGFARWQPCGGRRQTSRGNGASPSCRRTAPTLEPWLPSIEIQGVVGQSAADWSPDGTRIVTGGRDAQGVRACS